MRNEKQSFLKKVLSIRGMGAAITAFVGLIVIYVAFGLINPAVFSGQNIMNLLRSMSKYLLIGIAQSYILITGNIDLSIGSMVGMSAMVAATLMSRGVHPVIAILVALAYYTVQNLKNFVLQVFCISMGSFMLTILAYHLLKKVPVIKALVGIKK